MGASLIRKANRHPEIKTKVLEPLMRNIAKKGRTKEEINDRVAFASRQIVRRLHAAGKIDKKALSPNIHDQVSKELRRKIKKMKPITD
jgi:hypothetical protein